MLNKIKSRNLKANLNPKPRIFSKFWKKCKYMPTNFDSSSTKFKPEICQMKNNTSEFFDFRVLSTYVRHALRKNYQYSELF